MTFQTNRLYYEDNLEVLRNYEHFPSETVDLIYLDPPFNSARDYNVLFRDESGLDSDAQMEAFGDTWHWTQQSETLYAELLHGNSRQIADVLNAIRVLVGTNQLMAYLVMMTARLVALHRVLKPTGSLYLHCDPTASHYLKLILDAIFGSEHFRNEIIWERTNAKGQVTRNLAKNHDVIFYYVKSESFTWNIVYTPHDPNYVEKFYKYADPDGRRYQLDNLANPNKKRPNLTYEFLGVMRVWRWTKDRMQEAYNQGLIVQVKPGTVPRFKRYLDEQEGNSLSNVWTDIPPVQPNAKERTGYPTQKPLALLERIIQMSSNPGDMILDPFSGCGTAVTAAHKLGRRWVGIDITHLAITVMKHQLEQQLGLKAGVDYHVVGEPVDAGGARALALQDRHQFEWWAISLVGARPSGGDGSAVAPGARAKGKKGADKGIDEFIPFIEKNGKPARVLVSVKSGDNPSVVAVRDLRGVMEREQAAMGVLIILTEPTKPMSVEAVSAGFYHSEIWDEDYPLIQIATISDLLEGKLPKLPKSLTGALMAMQRIDRLNPEDKMDKLL